jgi:hypothetical protein
LNRYAECQNAVLVLLSDIIMGAVKLRVVMLSVSMLTFDILSGKMVCAFNLCGIMLNDTLHSSKNCHFTLRLSSLHHSKCCNAE